MPLETVIDRPLHHRAPWAAMGFALGLLIAGSASAGVKVVRGEDGRRIIFNESSDQRARRFSTQLVAIPEVANAPTGGLEPLIRQHAENANLDPRLIQALIQVESGYNAAALSNKGAMGLMQLMPGTAKDLAVTDPYDPAENIRAGIKFFRGLVDRFDGQLEIALAAYNAGPGAVEKYGGIPPYSETREYVRRILALYRGDATLREPVLRGGSLSGRKTHVIRRPGRRVLITTTPVR
jgi:Transglycosylase SLT domain